MFHNQKNPVVDYAWNIARVVSEDDYTHVMTESELLFSRTVRLLGILSSRSGFRSQSQEFADFFATYKATLPVTERLRGSVERG